MITKVKRANTVKRKDDTMGRFSVDIELANNNDLALSRAGHLAPEAVRRVQIRGVVDTGATRLVLPAIVAKQLGLPYAGKINARYADGRKAVRDLVDDVHLELLGRSSVFKAAIEPKRESALIGAIVLEDLDFLVDCIGQRLVPRDPHQIVSEIE